ncbi:MAG TPA: tetratricopeptide repeat protein [Sedimentisphaerales bacterium]|nr:tetratricopeptide repeat protein [Sedimentisphaerales bacterium]
MRIAILFELAIQLRPDFTHAHFNLARILMKKGRGAAAVAELQHTIQIDPNHVGALNMLGMALGRQQKFAEAQSHLKRAVRLDPDHARARDSAYLPVLRLPRHRDPVA